MLIVGYERKFVTSEFKRNRFCLNDHNYFNVDLLVGLCESFRSYSSTSFLLVGGRTGPQRDDKVV
jgi:hypothetical protein